MEKTTFSSYTQMVKGKIAPYFRNTGLTLDGIQAKHIQSFYLHELKTVSPGTVIHYHANIHKALILLWQLFLKLRIWRIA